MPRRPGLGKGLGALIPEGTPSTSETPVETTATSPLRQVPVASIRPNQFQPRKSFNDESLKTLAASVAELGVLQPLIVRPVEGEPDKYELIAGERRWRAAAIAELKTTLTTDYHSSRRSSRIFTA
jgi:ParB family transcriptional regulator, chromosome partitioning protein